MKPTKKSDGELIGDFLQGDQTAFEELVYRYQNAVYGYAYHIVGNFDDAQDLTQEVFIEAYTNISYLKEREKLAGWLRSVTRNICVSSIRQKERLSSFEKLAQKKYVNIPTHQELELDHNVMEAVRALSERNRLLITLFYIDGLSYKDIGNFLEIPLNTVKTTLSRARRQLREKLLQIVKNGFKRYELDPEFAQKVSKSIEERKNIVILGIKTQHNNEGIVHSLLQEAVQRCACVLAKPIDTANIMLFGIPTMTEEDAEHAVFCALFLREKLKEIGLKGFKAGVNVGLVEIYEQRPEGKTYYTPLGKALTFTLELMEFADEQILVSEGVYRLTQGRFVFRRIERGEGEPAVYEVVGFSEHPRKLWEENFVSTMIGRDKDLAKGKHAINKLMDGQGKIISIIGEAGVGKTRLLRELQAGLPEDLAWLEGRCVAYGKRMSFFPFLEMLRTFFDIKQPDSNTTIVEKIHAKIRELGLSSENALYITALLSASIGSSPTYECEEIKYLTAEQLRYKIFVSLRTLFRKSAEIQPILIVLEDMHWIDDDSYELLSFLMESARQYPLLFLLVYRPEQDENCLMLRKSASAKYASIYDEVILGELSADESRCLIRTFLNEATLPPDLEDRIIEKTGGNPLFIQEILRSMIDTKKLIYMQNRWEFAEGIGSLEVPDTIHSVIMSRMDLLEDETKQLLQCASVIGDVISSRLLESIYDGEHIKHRLTQLISFGFIQSSKPQLEYRFRHSLVHDIVTISLLGEIKQRYHQRIGKAIEELYSDRIEEYYELLAYHYVNSADHQKALEYLIKAGDKSKRFYANENALNYYHDALDVVDKFTNGTSALTIAIYDSIGDVLRLMGKHDDAINSYKAAMELCGDEKKADLYRKIGVVCENKHEMLLSLKYLELAEEVNKDPKETAMIYLDMVRTIVHQGSARRAAELCRKSLEILKNSDDLRLTARAYTWLGIAYGRKGDPEKGVQYAKRGLRMSIKTGDLNLMAWAYRMLGNVLLVKGEIDLAVEDFQKSKELFEKTGDNYGVAVHYWVIGGICSLRGEQENSIENYLRSIECDRDMKFTHPTVVNFFNISGQYARLGDLGKAFDYVKKGIDTGSHKAIMTPEFLSNFLSGALCSIEGMCERMGKRERFISFCDDLMEEYGDELRSMKLTRLYSDPERLESLFSKIAFCDDFDSPELDKGWNRVDPRGDCEYDMGIEPGWIAIKAAPGCNISDFKNLDAPRLLRDIQGDFAIETKMKWASDDLPMVGGLLVWKGDDGVIRL